MIISLFQMRPKAKSKKTYPNYFADTKEFLDKLQEIINKAGK
jgi:hypothetical protein